MDAPTAFFPHDLQVALDSAGVGVWSWEVGTPQVRWSSQIEALFGLAPGTFRGTFEAYLSVIHPDDRDWVARRIQESLDPNAAPYHLTHRIEVGGETRWLDCRGRVERDSAGKPTRMLGTVLDVTNRRAAEQRADALAEAFRLVGELSSDYVYVVVLPSLAPEIVAGSFERIVGLTPQQVKERGGWGAIIHPEDREAVLAMMARLEQGHPLVSEYRIIDAAGETRWLRDTVRPVVEGGKLVRLTGGVKEVTREKQLEQQWLQAQKLDALARLAGGIAHDFNNMLAVIQSGLDVVATSGAEGRDEVLGHVRGAVSRATELTRGLLSFARKPLGAPQVVHLDSALTAMRPVLARALGERHAFSFSPQAGSAAVRIDPGQLQVLLLNLLLNARDALGETQGEVAVTAVTATLGAGDRRRPPSLPPGDYAVLEVRDTGAGMRPEVLSHLFEPFFTTKGKSGTGLGLASCHGIATRAAGGITVTSQPGRGTTFCVALPLADEEPTPVRAEGSFSVGGVEALLLVEDELSLRRVAGRALRQLGYVVVEAATAEEALALAPELLDSLSLVVSDVGLPGLDGVKLAQRLREARPKLRVLLTSGYLPDESGAGPIERGELHFLAKPFSAEGLARRVRELLDQ